MTAWHKSIGIVALFALTVGAGFAADPHERARAALARSYPDLAKATIKDSPAPGILVVEFGDEVGYLTADGKYLFLGELIDVSTRVNLTNTTPTERGKAIARQLDEVGEKNMIVFTPEKVRRTMTVFTDVDCTYCARLHRDVPELVRNGVKVRYLFFPRGGKSSPAYQRSVAVWCANDRKQAIGVAKFGGKLDMKSCANPVEQHYQLGQQMGVSGTPTIFLDTGQRIGGYAPVDRMLATMGLERIADARSR